MRAFEFHRASADPHALLAQLSAQTAPENTQFLAGGTTLLDLMKLDVMQPEQVIDINALDTSDLGEIRLDGDGLYLGAMIRMSEAADDIQIREQFPVISQSLDLAASPQIRNMASLGGNVLQRTRCSYFRDTSYEACNKRKPGSGCAALEGFNRAHAVLGTSDQCIAAYPGDFAQALMVLDATVDILSATGQRRIRFAELHRAPGATPHLEVNLAAGEIISGFRIPPSPFARRSLFLKIRDRESYEFALASAAVAIDRDGDRLQQVRIALGGMAAMPWRAREAEAILAGQLADDDLFRRAADAAFAAAQPRQHNAFKIDLGKRTLIRALQQAMAMEI